MPGRLRRLRRIYESQHKESETATTESAINLLPDDRSAILSLTTFSGYNKNQETKDQLTGFLVTQIGGLQTITFPEGTMSKLRSAFSTYSEIYFDPRRENTSFNLSRVEDMCSALGQLLFNTKVVVLDKSGKSIIPESEARTLLEHLDNVLAPADEKIGKPRRLYLILHDMFSLVPFPAACWDQGGRTQYLVEHYEISCVPSIEVLRLIHERAVGRVPNRRALVVANPGLGNAGDEVRHIENLMKGEGWQTDEIDMLTNDRATRANFLFGNKTERIAGIYHREQVYTFVHLAVHGSYDFSSRTGYLVLGKDENGNEERCFDYEIADGQFQHTECVVAPICYSFATRPQDIELSGLAAAFIIAGARTYIGSVYAVNDAATRELVERFHDRWAEGELSPNSALRQAQLAMLRSRVCIRARDVDRRDPAVSDDPTFIHFKLPLSHPYCWAGFVGCSP